MTSNRMEKTAKTSALLAALLLAACGSGSGGGGGGGSVSPSASLATSGTAAKGVLRGALVQVFPIGANGRPDETTELVRTTTGLDGTYKLDIPRTGVVLVKLTAIAGTTMFDEATGVDVTPPTSFTLRAVLNLNTGDTPVININPFTDAAVQQALAGSGGLTAANVAQANASIAAALGFNPVTAPATFDAADATKPVSQLALALAAVSEIAKDADSAQQLGCTATGTAAQIACVVSAISTKTIGDPAVLLQVQNKIATVREAKGVLVNVAVTAPVNNPVATGSTPLELARAFFATLRSNAKALNAADLSLRSELTGLADQVQTRAVPLARSGVDAIEISAKAIEYYREVVVNQYVPFANERIYPGQGGCGLYSDDQLNTLATSVNDSRWVACNAGAIREYPRDANGYQKNCAQTGDVCYTVWSMRMRFRPQDAQGNSFNVYTQTRLAPFVRTAQNTEAEPRGANNTGYPARTTYGAAFPGNLATLVASRDSAGDYTQFALNGEMSPNFQIKEKADAVYAANGAYLGYVPNSLELVADRHNIALNATVTPSSAGRRLTATGLIEGIKANASSSRVELLTGSYATTGTDDRLTELNVVFRASTPDGAIAATANLSDFKTDAAGLDYAPVRMAFNGSIERAGTEFFAGSVVVTDRNRTAYRGNLPYSATNFELHDIAATGKVSIPTRPVMNVSFNASRKYANVVPVTWSGQYSQGAITLNGQYAFDGTNPGVATLESTSGIKVVVPDGANTATVTNSGTTVGELNLNTSRITYTDGTFEQY